jgi:hypothetical protein
MIRPKRPSTELKISMTRILTNLVLLAMPLAVLVATIDVQCWISSISQRCTTSIDADTDTANQIAHAHSQPRPEHGVTSVVIAGGVYRVVGDWRDLGGENNGHDDSVDSHNFTENNGDQVLGSNSRCFYAATDNGGASDENSPVDSVRNGVQYLPVLQTSKVYSYHAAPTTDRPMQSAMPKSAQTYGDTLSRKAPTCGMNTD